MTAASEPRATVSSEHTGRNANGSAALAVHSVTNCDSNVNDGTNTNVRCDPNASSIHNDVNVLALAGKIVGEVLAWEMVKAVLNAEFAGEERLVRRLQKVAQLESE